ncbi:hypothetical protein EGI22_16235 [Lacihabitans sp. LS3-19]|nr:hypothetical protein [Lacihabitans sp. LS3-19]
MVTAKGTVLDADSKLPLEGVLVRNLIDSEEGEKTKSDGVFDKVEIGRARGKCPEFNLEFSKEGYFSDTVFIESTQLQIIYLKQNK